jgi:tetratricopeptide (TPR) repeat protein
MRITLIIVLSMFPLVASAQEALPKGEEEVNRASAFLVHGDYVGAEPLLRRAVVDAPDDPYAHFALASVLRATGRYDDAIAGYERARRLFETTAVGANGSADIADCLYGIALARESLGDPRRAAQAWNDFIRFAQPFADEEPAVAIARTRAEAELRLARASGRLPGTQEASRPHTTR